MPIRAKTPSGIMRELKKGKPRPQKQKVAIMLSVLGKSKHK